MAEMKDDADPPSLTELPAPVVYNLVLMLGRQRPAALLALQGASKQLRESVNDSVAWKALCYDTPWLAARKEVTQCLFLLRRRPPSVLSAPVAAAAAAAAAAVSAPPHPLTQNKTHKKHTDA